MGGGRGPPGEKAGDYRIPEGGLAGKWCRVPAVPTGGRAGVVVRAPGRYGQTKPFVPQPVAQPLSDDSFFVFQFA